MAINLGDIIFGVVADTTRLRTAMADVVRFGETLDRVARTQGDAARAQEAAMRKVEASILAAWTATQRLQQNLTLSGAPIEMNNRLQRSFMDLKKELMSGDTSWLGRQRAMERFEVIQADVTRGLKAFSDEQSKAAAATREVEASIHKQDEALARASQRIQDFNQKLRNAGAPDEMIRRNGQALAVLGSEFSKGTQSAEEITKATRTFTADINGNKRAFDSWNQSVKSQAAEMSKDTAAIEKQEEAVRRLTNSIQNLQSRMQARNAPAALQQSTQNILTSVQAVTPGSAGADNTLRAATQALEENRRAIAGWHTAAGPAKASQSELNKGFVEFARAASLVTGPLSGAAYRITVFGELLNAGQLKMAIFTAGIIAGGYAFYKLGEAIIDNAEKLQRIQLHLTALSGSASIAAREMDFVRQVAMKFGVPLEETAKHFARLELATRGSRLEGDKTREMFSKITGAAAATGMSNSELATILDHVTSTMSRGRVRYSEFYTSFQHDIPAAMKIGTLAVADMGVKTEEGFLRLLKQGSLISDEFMPKFIDAWIKFNKIDLENPINNITTAHNRLKNALLDTYNAIDQVIGISAGYQTTLEKLTGGMISVKDNMGSFVIIMTNVGRVITWLLTPFTLLLNSFYAFLEVGYNITTTMLGPLGKQLYYLVAATGLFTTSVEEARAATSKNLDKVDEYIESQKELRTLTVSITNANEGLVRSEMALAAARGDSSSVARAMEQLNKLAEVRNRQQTAQRENPGRDMGLSQQEREIDLLLKEIKQFADESARQYKAMLAGPEELGKVMEDIAIEKRIEGWRDRMVRLNIDLKTSNEEQSQQNKLLREANDAFTSLTQQKGVSAQAKVFEDIGRQIEEANHFMEQLALSPGARQQAIAWVDIDKKVQAAIKSMREVHASFEDIDREAGGLRDKLEEAFHADQADKLAKALRLAEISIRELTAKGKLEELPKNQRKWAELQAEVNKLIEQMAEKFADADQKGAAVVSVLERMREAATQKGEGEIRMGIAEEIRKVDERIKEAKIHMDELSMSPGQRNLAQSFREVEKTVAATIESMKKAGMQTGEFESKSEELKKTLTQEFKAVNADKLAVGLKGANDTIRETETLLENVYKAPGQKEWLTIQNATNKAIEDFRDKLTREQQPLDVVTEKTKAFGDALKALRLAEYNIAHLVTPLQMVRDAFHELGKSITDNFVDALIKGTSLAEAWKNSWTSALSFVMKKITEFGVLNPIMNSLFGSNEKTFGMGGGGVGGVFGSLFKGFGGGGTGPSLENPGATQMHGGSGATRWSFVHPSVFTGAPRLHQGLAADEFPAILQHGEKVIPRGGSSGSPANVHIHGVVNPEKTEVKQDNNAAGGPRIDVILGDMMAQQIATPGSSVNRAIRGTQTLRRR